MDTTPTPAMNPHDTTSNLHSFYEEGWNAFYDEAKPVNTYGNAAGDAWEAGWMAAYRNDRECRATGGY